MHIKVDLCISGIMNIDKSVSVTRAVRSLHSYDVRVNLIDLETSTNTQRTSKTFTKHDFIEAGNFTYQTKHFYKSQQNLFATQIFRFFILMT